MLCSSMPELLIVRHQQPHNLLARQSPLHLDLLYTAQRQSAGKSESLFASLQAGLASHLSTFEVVSVLFKQLAQRALRLLGTSWYHGHVASSDLLRDRDSKLTLYASIHTFKSRFIPELQF